MKEELSAYEDLRVQLLALVEELQRGRTPEAREAAAIALGELGPRARLAYRWVEAATRDEDPRVRETAKVAQRRILDRQEP